MNTSLAGKKFVVVGLGKSGLGAIELLQRRGATVLALDENPTATVPFAGVTVHSGFPAGYWRGAEAVVVSPGVPLSKTGLQAAREAGVPVFGEIELTTRFMPPGSGPLLGITGTNGKSTTTALLGELVKAQYPNTFVGGNLGTAFSSAYANPAQAPYDFHVIELSSFQLEGCERASFMGAAILNLTADHIDRYASPTEYGAAKARIFKAQPANGFAVVNLEDREVMTLAKAAHVPVYGFTLGSQRAAKVEGFAMGEGHRLVLSFGGFEPFTVQNTALRGAHNLQNAMAAVLMAAKAGIGHAAIQSGLDSFGGLPHRLELIRSVNGVEWVNDSKATNVDSSLVAMKAFQGNVWLIAGGKGKGASYQPLVEAAQGKVKGVMTIGADAEKISDAFSHAGFGVTACETLEVAVNRLHTEAKAGDTVLLSPACASYDQFKNFEHRGDTFKELVRAL